MHVYEVFRIYFRMLSFMSNKVGLSFVNNSIICKYLSPEYLIHVQSFFSHMLNKHTNEQKPYTFYFAKSIRWHISDTIDHLMMHSDEIEYVIRDHRNN